MIFYKNLETVKGENYRLYMAAILFFLMGAFFAISKNLLTPYLWFDEAGQFWISKGLNHDSDPMSAANGIVEVIENNKYYNIDPGGFSILLHFWTYISNHHFWLRLLPFLFFVSTALLFIYLSYLWLKDLRIATLMGFVPMFIPIVFSMGFEVRAYSMECMGTVISIVALERLKNKLTYKNLFLWSCIFSFFMTSRYSEIAIIFIVSLYILYLIFTSRSSLNQKFISSLVYSFPLVISLILIYYYALSFQNKSIVPLGYLRYLSKSIGLLFESKNLMALGLLFVLTIVFFLKSRYPIIKRYETLLFVTISANFMFIILSFLGMHPWDFSHGRSSRSISLFILFGLCFAAFLGELLKPLFNSPGIVKYYLVAFIVIFALYQNKKNLVVRTHENFNLHHNTYYDFKKVPVDSFQHIYVDRAENPSIRYLFEYGVLKSKKGSVYPGRFTFVKYGHHRLYDGKLYDIFYKNCPKMNDLLDYDLLITPELWAFGRNNKWKRIDGTLNLFVKVNDDKKKGSQGVSYSQL